MVSLLYCCFYLSFFLVLLNTFVQTTEKRCVLFMQGAVLTIKVYPKDAPWMSVKLKELIRMRQQVFHANKSGLMYKYYRNAVNKERKRCKAKYYASKVKDLKGVNPRQWWSEVNKLSGSKKQNSSLFFPPSMFLSITTCLQQKLLIPSTMHYWSHFNLTSPSTASVRPYNCP